MLYLVTGTPGSGKTLNSIKFVHEADQFQGRTVYYHGIKQLSPDFGWIELDNEQALKWYELPSGSVVVFDEAYELFPVRHGAKEVPEHVKRLATHRHQGFDIVMICQKVTGQLDPFIRGLVGEHHHYQRIFGSKIVNRFTWFSCQENPNSAAARNNANIKPAKLDRKYYAAYHSADQHTHRMNLPWGKITLAVVAIALTIGCTLFFFQRFEKRFELVEDEVMAATAPVDAFAGSGVSHVPRGTVQATDLSFADRFKPEVKGLPWSAPIYADQIAPQTWPRPAACILRRATGGCTCYTTQATKLDVSRDFCMTVVHDGFFDWTRPDFARVAYIDRHLNPEPAGGVVGEGLPTPTDDAPRGPRAFLIGDSSDRLRMQPDRSTGLSSFGSRSSNPGDGAPGAPGASGRSFY